MVDKNLSSVFSFCFIGVCVPVGGCVHGPVYAFACVGLCVSVCGFMRERAEGGDVRAFPEVGGDVCFGLGLLFFFF